MVSLERGSSPKELDKTHNEFIKAINGMRRQDAYDFYKSHSSHYKYNTQEVKNAFTVMTKNRCSFCTRVIADYQTEMTVEHIETKSSTPHKIFLWSNLLCACRTCNIKRSTNLYNQEKYLDPTKVDNIIEFFKFNVDGSIEANDELSQEDKIRVDYMIDLYKLQRSELKMARRNFYRKLLNSQYYEILKELPEDDDGIVNLALFTYYKRSIECNGE